MIVCADARTVAIASPNAIRRNAIKAILTGLSLRVKPTILNAEIRRKRSQRPGLRREHAGLTLYRPRRESRLLHGVQSREPASPGAGRCALRRGPETPQDFGKSFRFDRYSQLRAPGCRAR